MKVGNPGAGIRFYVHRGRAHGRRGSSACLDHHVRGLQPQDGDHLGTAEFPYFAVLIPAKNDTQLDGITTYKAMAKASGKDTASGHPLVLSLRPASPGNGDVPKLNEPAADHKSLRVKVPAKAGDEKTTIVFELVFQGHGHIQ